MPFRRSLKPLVLVLALLGAPTACGGEDDGAPPGGGSPPPSPAERTPEAQEGPDENAGDASGGEGGTGEGDGASPTGTGGSSSSGGGDEPGGAGRRFYDPQRPDSPENDVPPPRGSPAERFERFCEENPQQCY